MDVSQGIRSYRVDNAIRRDGLRIEKHPHNSEAPYVFLEKAFIFLVLDLKLTLAFPALMQAVNKFNWMK
jgi:hypothetical protein